MCTNTGNCYACARINRKVDHPNGEEHFGGHPHKAYETEDDRDCSTAIDVDYRFFDPDRSIDLVKWYADKIERDKAIYSKLCLKIWGINGAAAACPKLCPEDGEDEGDQNEEDVAMEDISMYCRHHL